MESSTFGLEIYAANRRFFAGRAKSLIIPAEDGQEENPCTSCGYDLCHCSGRNAF